LTLSIWSGIVKYVLDQSAQLDQLFHALADATRRRMVERLVQGPASVTELAKSHAMSLQAVMQHLRVLETSGLVRSTKVGRVRTCQVEPPALRAVEDWVSRQRTGWERRLDRLDAELAPDPTDPAPPQDEGAPR
jgi:DNA-binding transcriptional ArsR family regulator